MGAALRPGGPRAPRARPQGAVGLHPAAGTAQRAVVRLGPSPAAPGPALDAAPPARLAGELGHGTRRARRPSRRAAGPRRPAPAAVARRAPGGAPRRPEARV